MVLKSAPIRGPEVGCDSNAEKSFAPLQHFHYEVLFRRRAPFGRFRRPLRSRFCTSPNCLPSSRFSPSTALSDPRLFPCPFLPPNLFLFVSNPACHVAIDLKRLKTVVAPLVTPAASPVGPTLAANTLPPSAAPMESTAALEVRLFHSHSILCIPFSHLQLQKRPH